VSSLEELFSLDGRQAVVTGASSGIGRALALALGRGGARVTLIGRDRDRLDSVAAELRDRGAGAHWHSIDLGDEAQTRELAGSEALAECDILVNCAGVNYRPPLGETSQAEYDALVAVNLRAPYLLGQAAGPAMAARGFGRIINIGSQQSWSAFGNSGVYGMTKAALAGLTRSQAEAWSAHGVTANTIIPGFVVTPMTLETIAEPGREAALAARTMIGRNGRPEDFCGVVVFLASASAGYLTGQTIAVDGGFSVH
jgi:gluconate 5-dehydrogenase